MVGVDPASDGLARARATGRRGLAPRASTGCCARTELPRDRLRGDLGRGARARTRRATPRPASRPIDLTPAARRAAASCPPVNLDEHLDAPNVNMITCGGQATIPIVHAVSLGRRRCRTPRSSRRSRRARPGPAPAPTSTSSPHTTARGHRGGRRRRAGQGDHRPQPGRAADDHARHGLLRDPGRRRPATRSRAVDPRDGRRGRRSTCPATRCAPSRSSTTRATAGTATAASRCSSRSRARRLPARRTPATSTS